MKLYGGANILKGGDIPRRFAPLLRGGANLLGGRKSCDTGIGWSYSGKSDALTLVVNKAVLFHGVRLFGSNGGGYEVKFTIKDKNVTGSYTSEQDSDGVPGYDVMLPNPIPLLPNQEITIIATITGPKSYYGNSVKSSVKIDDIVVTFKDAPTGLSSNTMGKTFGQFYKIFLFKL